MRGRAFGVLLVVVLAGTVAGPAGPAAAGPVTPPAADRMAAVGWGSGTLGDGSTATRLRPVVAAGLTDGVRQVSAGGRHSLAVDVDGLVWAWGFNKFGQVGDSTMETRYAPVRLAGITGVRQVSAGRWHSLAVKSDGTVWAWGHNGRGQLGIGALPGQLAPVRVPGLTGVVEVAAGDYHSLALKGDGTVWAWGNNDAGGLGINSVVSKNVPTKVFGLTAVVRITAGAGFSFAVRSDGRAWGWGLNSYGQLATGTVTEQYVPAPTVLVGVVSIAAGADHTLVVRDDGTVWAIGRTDGGQVPWEAPEVPDGGPRPRPVLMSALPVRARQVAAGEVHSVALGVDGTVWVWGTVPLPDGGEVRYDVPTRVAGAVDVRQIAAGWWHTVGVMKLPAENQ
jgi:alpha-tubulin suppressor-like RCC1 family protein